MRNITELSIVDWLFVIRLVPLILAGFIATRSKDYIGMIICILYLCVTSVNYLLKDPGLNAVFSTPLVFLMAWYIIKPDLRNRRNRSIKKIRVLKEK